MKRTILQLRTDLIDKGETFLEEIDICSKDPLFMVTGTINWLKMGRHENVTVTWLHS